MKLTSIFSRSYRTSILFCAAILLTTTSCRHKDFCWHHVHGEMFVDVIYDDDNDPDDAEIIKNDISASRVLAYHRFTGEIQMANDIDRNVNKLELEPNAYHFIAYNAGTQRIAFSSRDMFFTHNVTTRTCDILEPLYDTGKVESNIDLENGENVVIPAEPIWGVGVENVQCNVGDLVQLEVIPLHCRYSFEIRNVEGLGGISRISSFITGMSRGAELSSLTLHDTPVTVAVPASIDDKTKTIYGSFMCFGQNPAIETRHRMGIFIEKENGAKIKLLDGDKFDVTDQVVNAPNRRRVHIIIDGLKIPDVATGSGFEVTVKPWGEGENLDIDYDLD